MFIQKIPKYDKITGVNVKEHKIYLKKQNNIFLKGQFRA